MSLLNGVDCKHDAKFSKAQNLRWSGENADLVRLCLVPYQTMRLSNASFQVAIKTISPVITDREATVRYYPVHA